MYINVSNTLNFIISLSHFKKNEFFFKINGQEVAMFQIYG